MDAVAVPFNIFAPLTFFEKAEAPKGQQRRIAGVISTELRDKQRELLLQKGLDFSPFLKEGYFNDNHGKTAEDIVGYPTGVTRFQKGDKLPDGNTADFNGTWAEGYLLDTGKGQKLWELGQALQKSGNHRRLGFSLEGGILERSGPDRKTVTKAVVKHVAVTHVPVGEATRMEILAKSMEEVEKALTMGAPLPAGEHISEAGPQTGEGAGKVLAGQSLEGDEHDEDERPLTKSEVVAAIHARFPGCTAETAERAFQTLAKSLTIPQEKNPMKTPVTGSGLQAALDSLENAAAQAPNRAQELFQKSVAGTISDDEREELVKAVAGKGTLAARVTSALQEEGNDELRKAHNVSGYLAEMTGGVRQGLAEIAEVLQKSEASDGEFRGALARAVMELGRQHIESTDLIKSMAAQIEALSGQPARAPKSAGLPANRQSPEPMNKSFAGQGATDGVGLPKRQVQAIINDMLQKGQREVAGEDLITAGSKYETSNTMSKSLQTAVLAHGKTMGLAA